MVNSDYTQYNISMPGFRYVTGFEKIEIPHLII